MPACISPARSMTEGGMIAAEDAERQAINSEQAAADAQDRANAQAYADRDSAVAGMQELVDMFGPSMEPANATDGITAVRAANDWIVQEAREGLQQLADAYDQARNMMAETTQGKGGFWFNLSRRFAGTFKSSLADAEAWGLLFAGTKGENSLNNPFVQALQSYHADAVGFAQAVQRRFVERYIKDCEQLARPMGYTTEKVCTDLGHVANAFHTPEANQHRLARWREEIARLEALQAEEFSQDRLEEIGRLQQNIDQLTQYLDASGKELLDSEGKRVRVISAMYTDGEARQIIDAAMRTYGVDENTLYRITQPLRDAFEYLGGESRRAGLITEQEAMRIPHFENYVAIRTAFENSLGAGNDVTVYNPATFHAREGVGDSPIMDAYSTLGAYTRRLSRAISSQELGNQMLALQRQGLERGQSNGLRATPYDQLIRLAMRGDSAAIQRLNNPDGFGLVVREVVQNADGTQSIVKHLMNWDQNWTADLNGTRFSGAEINKAFNAINRRADNAMLSALTAATSARAQLYCRLVPTFAPINSLRDGMERLTHMGASVYQREDGSTIAGWRMIPQYIANYARAGQILLGMMDKSLDLAKTPEGEIFREYIRGGLKLEYQPGGGDTAGSALERAMLDTGDVFGVKDEGKLAGFRNALRQSVPGRSFNTAMRALNGWNDYFSNIAGFAQYLTMRQRGVTMEEARAHTLGVMNMYQRGTATPLLRAFYPFQIPTAQSVAAMARTVGLAPRADGSFKPNLRGLATITAEAALIGTAVPLMKSTMGKDADGNDRLDNIPLGELSRAMWFGYGRDGEAIKVPMGFGPMQIVSTLVHGLDRVQRGLMPIEDAVAETLVSVARNVSPTDWPSFSMKQHPTEFFTALFTPDIAKPIVDVANNINSFGNPITYHDPNDIEAAFLSGKTRTPAVYHQLAKLIHGFCGADFAPEQIEHVIVGYASGPLRAITGLLSQNSLHAAGIDKTNAEILGPWMTAMGMTMAHGTASNLTMRRMYQELENIKSEINRLGVKIRDDSYGSNKEKKVAYQTEVLRNAGMDDDKIQRYFVLSDATEEIKKESRALRKQEGMEHWFEEGDTDYIREQFQNYSERKHAIALKALEQAGML